MTTWLNTIQNQSATQVAMGFLNSQELTNKNLSNEEFIDIMYQTMFNRQADSGGRNDWLEKMRNGRTKQSVMFGFFQSQEFKNLTDSFGVNQILSSDRPSLTGVESYVDRFYRLVLKRNYDENGFDDWVKQLTNKTKNPTEIANGFLFSPEYTNQNENDSTFLDTCYKAFFDRDADTAGKSDWLNKITTQNYTRQQIFEGFTGSQEFTNLVNSFNLDSATVTLPTQFTINNGRLLGSQCAQCHGTNGISSSDIDSIRGEDNLTHEIYDDDPLMNAQAKGYTSTEIIAIETWLKNIQ